MSTGGHEHDMTVTAHIYRPALLFNSLKSSDVRKVRLSEPTRNHLGFNIFNKVDCLNPSGSCFTNCKVLSWGLWGLFLLAIGWFEFPLPVQPCCTALEMDCVRSRSKAPPGQACKQGGSDVWLAAAKLWPPSFIQLMSEIRVRRVFFFF